MEYKLNNSLIFNARSLRKNMTKEERHLWFDYLKNYPVKFRRQTILGKYIADFYSPSAKLIIELDGSQHYHDQAIADDAKRTEYLEKFGLKVIRIPNNEINRNFRGVCEFINNQVKLTMKD